MQQHLSQLVAGRPLSTQQMEQAFESIMTGQASPAQIGAMLALLQQRGPTVAELVGAARVMRRMVNRVQVPPGFTVLDTCGTGGDHSGTFNISTAAALVVAAAGRPHGVVVAKHGNRSVTSRSGSSQVLEALGVRVPADGPCLTRCLESAGLCFCFAPAHHPAMKHAMPVRAELGFRTIFNLLGPLTNPAGATRQVVGVFDAALTEPIARVLAALGCERAMVVHGQLGGGGLDELSNAGPTMVSELRAGQVRSARIEPEQLGLARGRPEDLQADSPQASAALVHAVLSGAAGGPRDIVCLNSAAGLVVSGLAADLAEGLRLAEMAIDSGAAAATLQRLVTLTQAAG